VQKKSEIAVFFCFLFISLFGLLFISCSNNPLANTTWQDADGDRTITFGETTFRWRRDSSGFDERGTYIVSKDAVFLTFDRANNITQDGKQTGSLINGVLSFTAGLEAFTYNPTRINIEFRRVR